VGVATRLRGNHELRSGCSYPQWGTPTAPLLTVFGLTKMRIAGMDQGPIWRTRKGRRPFVKKRVLVTDGAGFFGSHLCALNAIIASLCHPGVDPSFALFVSSQTGVCCSSFRSVDEMACVAEHLIADETEWRKVSARCRSYMDRMHGEHVVLKPYVTAIEEAARRRKMTRIEQTATVFLVTALGAAQKRTLQLLNSIEKGPIPGRTGLFEACGALLPQITPDCASQEWCADFRRGWDFRGLNQPSKWLRSFDPEVLVCVNSYCCSIASWRGCWRGCEFRSSKSFTHGTGGRRGQCQRPDQLRQRDAANHVAIPRYQA
jgi:hypothetical protein